MNDETNGPATDRNEDPAQQPMRSAHRSRHYADGRVEDLSVPAPGEAGKNPISTPHLQVHFRPDGTTVEQVHTELDYQARADLAAGQAVDGQAEQALEDCRRRMELRHAFNRAARKEISPAFNMAARYKGGHER